MKMTYKQLNIKHNSLVKNALSNQKIKKKWKKKITKVLYSD